MRSVSIAASVAAHPRRSPRTFGEDLIRHAKTDVHIAFTAHHLGCDSGGLVLGAPSTSHAVVLSSPDRLDTGRPCPAHLAFSSCAAGVGQYTARLHAVVPGRDTGTTRRSLSCLARDHIFPCEAIRERSQKYIAEPDAARNSRRAGQLNGL